MGKLNENGKRGTYFWGFLLISIGLLLLYNQFYNDLDLIFVFQLWPILFVIWGTTLLRVPDFIKNILSALSGVVLALFIAAIMFNGFDYFSDNIVFNNDENEEWEWDTDISDTNNYVGKTFTQYYEAQFDTAKFVIDGGAGVYTIKDTSSYLIEVKPNSKFDEFNLSSDSDSRTVYLKLPSNININLLKKSSNSREASIKLNSQPLWDFDFNIGATKFNADFSPYKLKNMKLNCGASQIDLKFGNKYDTTNISINAAASKIRIKIPKEFGAEIYSNSGLSNNRFPDFSKFDDNVFRSSNFLSTTKKFFIQISSGITDIKVIRY